MLYLEIQTLLIRGWTVSTNNKLYKTTKNIVGNTNPLDPKPNMPQSALVRSCVRHVVFETQRLGQEYIEPLIKIRHEWEGQCERHSPL
jgi:hypothetical protein